MKKIKILHIVDMHFRHMGRLFYSTARKLNNGFILNGYNVLQISDRDILHRNKNIFDISGDINFGVQKIKEIKNSFPSFNFCSILTLPNACFVVTVLKPARSMRLP